MSTRPSTTQVEGFHVAAPPKRTTLPEPKWNDLEPLPGGGDGSPIFISNNPEIFTGTGLLAGTTQPAGASSRSTTAPISGLTNFGYYLFHINRTGGTKRVFLLASTVGDWPVSASVSGALNANAWGPGASASVYTGKAMVTRYPISRTIEILPGKPAALGYIDVYNGHCVDGRFAIRATGGLRVWDVAAPAGASTSEAATLARTRFAPGEIKSPNAATGAMGRCAGLYRHDRWNGKLEVEIDSTPFVRGFRFDERGQAFEGLATYKDSDPKSSGNYGSLYDLELTLTNTLAREAVITVEFASYPAQFAPADLKEYWAFLSKRRWSIPSRLWDGHAAVAHRGKNRLVQVFTKPTSPNAMRASLLSATLAAGATETARLRIPVPGLISIPAAIIIRATAANAGALAVREKWTATTVSVAAAPTPTSDATLGAVQGEDAGDLTQEPSAKEETPTTASANGPSPAPEAPPGVTPPPPIPRSKFNPEESWTIAFLRERRRQRDT